MGSISLAFAFGQLWWGLTQPFAGAVADRVGAGRVLLVGVLLVALGTLLTPLMTTTGGLILAIGVLAAGGVGMAGPSVQMAATARLIPAERRGMATGVVNAGGSFGQFLMAPLAMLFGLVMLSHQVGGFLGAWLGGQVFEATGNCDGIWYLDIVLAVAAALVHLPIQERTPVRWQPA